jgi:hypothetical protein
MAKNLEKLKKIPAKTEAREDNRAVKLHWSRFLGRHICVNTEIWLKARNIEFPASTRFPATIQKAWE